MLLLLRNFLLKSKFRMKPRKKKKKMEYIVKIDLKSKINRDM